MDFQPKDLFEKLEFDKILVLLEKECLGEPARAAVLQLPLFTDTEVLEILLKEVKDCKLGLSKNDSLPLETYDDLSEDLTMLSIEGYVLSEEGFLRIRKVLMITGNLFRYFTPERQKIYPSLYNLLRPVSFDEGLLAAISRVFDEEGNIRSDASPTLLQIRKDIHLKERELDKVFRSLLITYRNNGWLADNAESIRNNRRVLSVPVEHKRKIRGIIHDESTTGRTAFIEPEPIIEINNDIFDLQQEERREIWRILRDLSTTLRLYIPAMTQYYELVIRFDIILAKARLAIQMNGNMPRLVARPQIGTEMGKHPLLFLKNKKNGRETVPFDLHLHGKNRIVVLSGPNAGGKSVLMKSVGLMQLMLQAGMLVPVDEISEMGIFEKIFADIGDQQSLEDDLSTYSSRLVNMRNFLERADSSTLVLIDEFGSGTDPKMGGAIAEAILRELNEKKVFGIITTHYSNLKMFAFKNEGIINGCMLFDQENLMPTYRFKAGRPGSSYAFEIAQKSGLNKKILVYARQRSGKQETAIDDLLIDLQREKKEVEEKLATLKEKEQHLEKLLKSYEELHRDLEYRRKKFKLEVRQQALQQVTRDNQELEQLVKDLREQKNLEKARELLEQQRIEKKKAEEDLMMAFRDLQNIPTQNSKGNVKNELRPGDYVRIKNGGAFGNIESIHKNKVIVSVGHLRITLPLQDVETAPPPLNIRTQPGIQQDTIRQNAVFDRQIDIRGMKPDEALKVLQDFLDKAIINSANQLRIVHGRGTGALRNLVRLKLREYNAVKNATHPSPDEGGDGVTLVEL